MKILKQLFLLPIYIFFFFGCGIFTPFSILSTRLFSSYPNTMYALNRQISQQTIIASAQTNTSIPLSGSYACILENDAYFYEYPDEKRALFLLPKSYYVKVLDYQTDYCKVEYLYDDSVMQKLTGYAKTDKLTFVEYVPKRPYLYYLFDVYYKLDDKPIEDSAFLTQIKVTCVYYGDFHLGGKTYCYVLRGDTFGYIPKPNTISYEENTEYADYLSQIQPPTSETPTSNPSQTSPLLIAILVALCLLAPVLAALILKQPKRAFYPDTEDV